MADRRAGYRAPVSEAVGRLVRRQALAAYLGGVALVTGMTLAAGWALLRHAETSPPGKAALLLLLALAGSQLGVAVVNWLSTVLVRPVSLPRLDFARGIPAEHRTLVVIPSLLTTPEVIDALPHAHIRMVAGSPDHQVHRAVGNAKGVFVVKVLAFLQIEHFMIELGDPLGLGRAHGDVIDLPGLLPAVVLVTFLNFRMLFE